MSERLPLVAVATSGGRDSTALMHATLRQMAAVGGRVLALHVHHGLHPEADEWAAHVGRQCRRWAQAGWPAEFRMTRLAGQPGPGDSVEAWARRGRYQALANMAHEAGCEVILLAHHRRDQASGGVAPGFIKPLRRSMPMFGAGSSSTSRMPATTIRARTGIACA
jgi:tRNA(Ile)-lysidine synthase